MDIPDSRPEEIRNLIGVLPENNRFPTFMTGEAFLVYMGRLYGQSKPQAREKAIELLTPVPRGQFVIGKLLAILSLWLGMIPIAMPYLVLVARGTDVMLTSVMLLIIPGTLLVCLSASLGVFISGLSPTNLVSFGVGFVVILLLAAPLQLPGSVKDLPFVHWFMVVNPITAVTSYQSAVIDGQAWTNELGLLLAPVIALLLTVGLGTRFLNGRLSLQGGINP